MSGDPWKTVNEPPFVLEYPRTAQVIMVRGGVEVERTKVYKYKSWCVPDPKCKKCLGRGHVGFNLTREEFDLCPKCILMRNAKAQRRVDEAKRAALREELMTTVGTLQHDHQKEAFDAMLEEAESHGVDMDDDFCTAEDADLDAEIETVHGHATCAAILDDRSYGENMVFPASDNVSELAASASEFAEGVAAIQAKLRNRVEEHPLVIQDWERGTGKVNPDNRPWCASHERPMEGGPSGPYCYFCELEEQQEAMRVQAAQETGMPKEAMLRSDRALDVIVLPVPAVRGEDEPESNHDPEVL